jgi:hypothetical protein
MTASLFLQNITLVQYGILQSIDVSKIKMSLSTNLYKSVVCAKIDF